MMNRRYHTNYKGQLVDNTRDWEYKPLTKETPIRLLNHLNDEFEKITELFNDLGLGDYDYNVLERIIKNSLDKTPKESKHLLTTATLTDDGNVKFDGKEHTLEETVDVLNDARNVLWEKSKLIDEMSTDMESMQQKINVLYTEIIMSKEHMSSDEWKDYKNRRHELEEQVGVEWIRL